MSQSALDELIHTLESDFFGKPKAGNRNTHNNTITSVKKIPFKSGKENYR